MDNTKTGKIYFTMLIFTFSIAFIFQVGIGLYSTEKDFNKQISFIHKTGFPKLENQSQIIQNELSAIKNYSNMLSNLISDLEIYDKDILSNLLKKHFLVDFGIFQLRLLNSEGIEIIRYDLDKKKYIKEITTLQDKSNRYYYQEAKKIDFDDIYLSKFDLNMEYGVIETPLKHTTRIIKKIKISNDIFYLAINYDITEMFKRSFTTTLYDIFLIENDNQINLHLNYDYSFSKQRKLGVYLKDIIIDKKQYITQKKILGLPYKIVILIKKSQLDTLQNRKEESKKTIFIISLLISMLVTLILFIIISQYYKIKLHKKMKEVNETLEYRVKEEIVKNIQNERQLFEQSKMASMGEMIGNIAHQWRQPLSGINAAILNIQIQIKTNKYNLEDENDRDKFFKMINNKSNRIVQYVDYLSKTIDTFRDFVKNEKKLTEVVLQEVIDKSIDLVSAGMDNSFIELKNNIDYKTPIIITMVTGELEQVIVNILNNARDILIQKSVQSPWISIYLSTENDTVIITIEDNGGGVPQENISRIFDPYFTTKHQSQGTGLGLNISYKIITQSLNGKLYVKNTKNGAKFFMELPLNNKDNGNKFISII